MSIGDAGARAAPAMSGDEWKEQHADVIEQAGDVMDSLSAGIAGYLKRNPLVAGVLAAVVVGALVGWLLSDWGRRRKVLAGRARVRRQAEVSTQQARKATRTTASAVGGLAMYVLRSPLLRGMLIRGAMRSLRKVRRK